MALAYAPQELRSDRFFVANALALDGKALSHAAPELRDDKELVLLAVGQNGMALSCASAELQRDREVVLTAVAQDGLALAFASPELKKDHEVVLIAVAKAGMALDCADILLRSDRSIVEAAVSHSGLALVSATEDLKCDAEIVLTAVAENARALGHASPSLARRPEAWQRLQPLVAEVLVLEVSLLSGRAALCVYADLENTRLGRVLLDCCRKLHLPSLGSPVLLLGSRILPDTTVQAWGLALGEVHELHLIVETEQSVNGLSSIKSASESRSY
mmetsp:Transcript_41522/g.93224  ORF Transcript_41522/g.93224 Transcript_41522/m.93224 type:complete len:274 (-) Transcript_41522:6-827(-)